MFNVAVRGSTVSIVTMGWTIWGSDHGRGKIFLFSVCPDQFWPIHPPIQWVLGALSLGIKRLQREADYSSQSSAEVENEQSYAFIPPVCLHGIYSDNSALLLC
jgi:hypothetical protein